MTLVKGNHPYADRFPMLPDDELDALAASIAESGQRHPIVVNGDGLILDGRNRYAACERAGVQPVVETYEGTDAAEFVLNANTDRRHQSTGSRAMSTALVLADAGKRDNGRWRRGSVPANRESSVSDAWEQAMRQAGAVLDHTPDLALDVVSGALALDAAYRQACQARDAEAERIRREQEEAAAEEAAREFIEREAPDLAERVDGTDLESFLEALDLWRRRNREEAERLAREKAEREAEAARRESERRAAITNLRSVLTYTTSAVLTPEELAADYDDAIGEFDQSQLDFSARTVAAIAERSRRG